jgi:hypothetical protein
VLRADREGLDYGLQLPPHFTLPQGQGDAQRRRVLDALAEFA